MALDTYGELWRKVLLRCPLAGQFLARDWINNAFRRVAERRAWTWLQKRGQFLTATVYDTGTVAVTHNSTAVVGTGTTFTAAMAGRQFKIAGSPIYTIATFTNGTNLVLDDEYGGDTDATAEYQIYKCYMDMPTDFHSFMGIWDAESGDVLNWTTTQSELNARDAGRTNTGDPFCAAFLDYYTQSGETISVPRYELWPHQTAQAVYPFIYEMRPTDLEDSSATLPRFLHGDVLTEMALEQAAMWPGPSDDKKNPYFNRDLARMHGSRAEQLILEMERQDEEVGNQNINYVNDDVTYIGDADWLTKHAI